MVGWEAYGRGGRRGKGERKRRMPYVVSEGRTKGKWREERVKGGEDLELEG